VALASQLKALGQDARLCVPPDFRGWIAGLGFTVTPIGPELRSALAAPRAAAGPLSAGRRRQLAEESVAAQFQTIAHAADGIVTSSSPTARRCCHRRITRRRSCHRSRGRRRRRRPLIPASAGPGRGTVQRPVRRAAQCASRSDRSHPGG
jgi:hypothetical protein